MPNVAVLSFYIPSHRPRNTSEACHRTLRWFNLSLKFGYPYVRFCYNFSLFFDILTYNLSLIVTFGSEILHMRNHRNAEWHYHLNRTSPFFSRAQRRDKASLTQSYFISNSNLALQNEKLFPLPIFLLPSNTHTHINEQRKKNPQLLRNENHSSGCAMYIHSFTKLAFCGNSILLNSPSGSPSSDYCFTLPILSPSLSLPLRCSSQWTECLCLNAF